MRDRRFGKLPSQQVVSALSGGNRDMKGVLGAIRWDGAGRKQDD
jgi:hypothetical protein